MISKKFLAIVLVMCMLLPTLPVQAKMLYPDGVTTDTYVSEATIIISSGNIRFEGDATFTNIIKNGFASKIQGSFKVSEDLTIPVNTGFSNASKLEVYVTSVLKSGGDIAKKMVEEAAANPELDALMEKLDGVVISVTNGKGSSNDTADEFKRNITDYVFYKSGGVTSFKFTATLTVTGIEVDDAFVDGTFFLNTNALIKNFVDGTNWVGSWASASSDGKSIYIPSDIADRNLDYVKGPYAVYEVPATGVYDVWALKRTYNDSNDRSVSIEIAGKKFDFRKANLPSGGTNGYSWQPDNTSQTLSLVKGQNIVLRYPADVVGTGKYSNTAGCYGLAFVPRTGDEPHAIPYLAAPNTSSDIASKVVGKSPVSLGAATTKTVTVNGVEVTVSSTDAETYYPNIELSDANGNYITQPTVLDALVAATKQGDVELPFALAPNVLEEDALSLNLESKTVTPITYETTSALGNPWPTHSNGSSYGCDITPGTQVYCTNSSTPYTTKVTAPKTGKYYLFARGMGWSDDRYLNIKINDSDAYMADGDIKFFYHEGSNNADDGKTRLKVSPIQVDLNEGENTVTLTPNGGWIRLNYIGFVEAESHEAATELATQITASKAAFDEYFAVENSTYSYVLGTITNYDKSVFVNGKLYNKDYDKIVIPDGAVITTGNADKTNFAPLSMEGIITNFGGSTATDALDNSGIPWSGSNQAYNMKFVTYSPTLYPVDMSTTDALAGCYLNGYIGIRIDMDGSKTAAGIAQANTTGDDRLVKMYVHDWPIEHSAYNYTTKFVQKTDENGNLVYDENEEPVYEVDESGNKKEINTTDKRIELGFFSDNVPNWSDNLLTADIDGEGDKTYHSTLRLITGGSMKEWYDFTNLYLTNSSSKADLEVEAVPFADGVYSLITNKTVPVYIVRVIKSDDGEITSVAVDNSIELLDFTDEDGIQITVAENETVYVWKGTALPNGNSMVPLCAPISR